MPSSTAQTPSVIGSSTPMRRDRSRSTGAVVSPSTTCPICALASSGVAPCAINSPARRLRPSGWKHVAIRSPIPARPENVSGSAPQASPSRVISTRPRVMRADLALSPRPRPSTAPAESAITFFAAPQSSTPITSPLDVDAERARVDRVLQAQRERFVVGCDHGGARQSGRDLLRHVRPREHRHGATLHEGREPVAGRRVEAFDETEDRRVAAHSCQHLAERAARDRDGDDVSLLVRRAVDRHARRDEHVVAAVAEQTTEHPTPRARADDDESHERSRKSTTTGTPSRLKRSRSWFSTQYA